MKVLHIMHHGVETIGPENTALEAARKMHDMHIGALPVVNNEQILGILTDRDICCKVVANGYDAHTTLVHEIMTRELVTCYDDQEIEEAVDVMANMHLHRLAVLSRSNSLSGMLSVDDLTQASLDMAGTVLEASTDY